METHSLLCNPWLARRNANVDHEERMQLLTSFKDCMVDRFKANQKVVDNFKAQLKDSMLRRRERNECQFNVALSCSSF